MKKIYALVIVAMMSVCAMAQHEIGGIVGGLNGLSYKYWISDNLALQADLAVGLTSTQGSAWAKGQQIIKPYAMDLYDFTLNPNLLYHFDLPSNFKFYLGGGVNLGFVSALQNTDPDGLLGKFGANGVLGAAYEVGSAPLVLALDFRPGYGLAFNDSPVHINYFDWKVGFAIRYAL